MSGSFAHEQSVYPFVHATVNLALYMCSRRWALVVIAFYLWESIERVLGKHIGSLAEDCDDSLIGDPVIGLLAFSSFYVLDFVTGFDVVFRRHASLLARVFVFLAIGAASFVAPQLETTHFYWGIAVFLGIYLAVALFGFRNLVFYAGASDEIRYAGQSVVIWLLAVVVYAIISIVVLDGPLHTSSWMRVFFIALAFLAASLVGLLSVEK